MRTKLFGILLALILGLSASIVLVASAQDSGSWQSGVICGPFEEHNDNCDSVEAGFVIDHEITGTVSLVLEGFQTINEVGEETVDVSIDRHPEGSLSAGERREFAIQVEGKGKVRVQFDHAQYPKGSMTVSASWNFVPAPTSTPTATATSTATPSATPTETPTGTPEPTSTATATPVVTATPTATVTVMPTVTPTNTPVPQRCDGGVWLDANIFIASDSDERPENPQTQQWVYGNEFLDGEAWRLRVSIDGVWSDEMEVRHDYLPEWVNWVGGDHVISFLAEEPSLANFDTVVISTWLWNPPNNTFPQGEWLRWPLEHAEKYDEYNAFRVCDSRLYAIGVQLLEK